MPRVRLDEATDSELVAAIARGDDVAMAEVVRRHRQPVLAFAHRLVGDHARAEEICQEVFVRLWERCDRFDPQRGALSTFLLAMTHGRALDVVRSDVARRRREARDVEGVSGSGRGADEPVVARTVAETVRNALSLIPESERRALELAFFGGLSYRTVASMLDEPEGTVKTRIRTGLARLRTVLADEDLQGG